MHHRWGQTAAKKQQTTTKKQEYGYFEQRTIIKKSNINLKWLV